jgi:trehalose-phosphatase
VTVDVSPGELAAMVRPQLATVLMGLDVDGVLAPIVEHADDARLSPGVSDALVDLCDRTAVAILSGRSLASLEGLFRFPACVHVIGSHGLEPRDAEPMALDEREQAVFDRLGAIAARAVRAAGSGAWLELKPASVVIHSRAADPALAGPALAEAVAGASDVAGAQVKHGREVVELLARSASKGEALLALAARLGRSPIVFLGDDLTDEDAFVMMSGHDIAVRVGPGATAATHRLRGPEEVAEFLGRLVAA